MIEWRPYGYVAREYVSDPESRWTFRIWIVGHDFLAGLLAL